MPKYTYHFHYETASNMRVRVISQPRNGAAESDGEAYLDTQMQQQDNCQEMNENKL